MFTVVQDEQAWAVAEMVDGGGKQRSTGFLSHAERRYHSLEHEGRIQSGTELDEPCAAVELREQVAG